MQTPLVTVNQAAAPHLHPRPDPAAFEPDATRPPNRYHVYVGFADGVCRDMVEACSGTLSIYHWILLGIAAAEKERGGERAVAVTLIDNDIVPQFARKGAQVGSRDSAFARVLSCDRPAFTGYEHPGICFRAVRDLESGQWSAFARSAVDIGTYVQLDMLCRKFAAAAVV